MKRLVHSSFLLTIVFPSPVLCQYLFAEQYVTDTTFLAMAGQNTGDINISTLFVDKSDEEPPDTIGSSVFTLPEFVVTALRPPATVSNTPSAVVIIPSSSIQRTTATNLADVVGTLPGVFVKEYGSYSGIKTISQRGLGAEHTVVLLNGLRLGAFQNGTVDLGMIDASNIDRIEIIQGGYSAAYGADAVGGLVNVLTAKPDSTRFSFSMSSGSEHYAAYRGTLGLSPGPFGFSGSYRSERSLGDYRFLFHESGQTHQLERVNADFATHLATVYATWDEPRENATLFGRYFTSERGVAGPVVSTSSTSVARQLDTDALVQGGYSNRIDSRWALFLQGQFRNSWLRYHDQLLMVNGEPIDSYYRNIHSELNARTESVVSDKLRMIGGFDGAVVTATGNAVQDNPGRQQAGIYAAADIGFESTGFLAGFAVSPAVRYDWIDSHNAFTPHLGIIAHVTPFDAGIVQAINISARATIGRSFRAPTFNELFYLGGGGRGNGDLIPEVARGFDVGLTGSFRFLGTNAVRCTYYNTHLDDRIVWVSAGALGVTPKNIRSVEATGVELLYEWRSLDEVLSMQVSYSTQNSKKMSEDFPGDPNVNTQLPYVPEETATAHVGLTIPIRTFVQSVSVGATGRYVGFRYTSEDNSRFLPAYALIDAAVRVDGEIGLTDVFLKCDMTNIFEEDYQVINGYPMPLLAFRFTLGIEY